MHLAQVFYKGLDREISFINRAVRTIHFSITPEYDSLRDGTGIKGGVSVKGNDPRPERPKPLWLGEQVIKLHYDNHRCSTCFFMAAQSVKFATTGHAAVLLQSRQP